MGRIDHGVQGVLCGTSGIQVMHPLEVLSSQGNHDSSFSSNISPESPSMMSISAVQLKCIVHEGANHRHPSRMGKHIHQRLLPIQISLHSKTRVVVEGIQCMKLHLKRRLDEPMLGFVQLRHSFLFPRRRQQRGRNGRGRTSPLGVNDGGSRGHLLSKRLKHLLHHGRT